MEADMLFREFISQRYPEYRWYKHCEVLCEVLQRVADDELKRVLIFMPPRHGATLLVSRLFPAYYLGQHPDRQASLISYQKEMSELSSRFVGGKCWAANVINPFIGFGMDLGVIDAPIKGPDWVEEDTLKSIQSWYDNVFVPRLGSGSAVIATPYWDAEALGAWLLTQGDSWHVINFAAIKEEESIQLPVNCTLEPDWRQPGEVLCPERFPASRLTQIKESLGDEWWLRMYQQRPSGAPAIASQFKSHAQ